MNIKTSTLLLVALLFGILSTSVCHSAEPQYANRAEAIVAQIKNPASKYVVVVAHRGDWRNFPENSLLAMESAISMGVDMIEIDLHMTKDSVLVLCHDADVLRCTNFKSVFANEPGKSPKVCDLTYEEIQKLSLQRAHCAAVVDTLRMPTLEQTLLCCKDRVCLNVDKGYDYYDQVLEISERLGTTDQLLIKGTRPIGTVQAFESRHAHNMMYMPIVNFQKSSGIKLFLSYQEQGVVPLAYEVCWGKNSDATFVDASKKIIAQGSKVWVNTIWSSLCGGDGNDDDAAFLCDDPGTVYQQYLDKGVSMIQTDRPALLIGWLEKMGRHTLPPFAQPAKTQAPSAVSLVPNPCVKAETGQMTSCRKVRTKIDASLAEEEYTINIGKQGVKVCGGSKKALFWAEQTLEQIRLQSPEGKLPCLYIEDKPAFSYRGMLIDCSRHFLSVEEVKSCIDIMAAHKLNKLHWHLTDDQGWRIEIKKYPELTAKGSVRARTKIGHHRDEAAGYDSTPYGGFYTQDEVRDIVRYAADRYIDVIPEIEMPGHSQEVLAVFPQFGCKGTGYKVREEWGISKDVLCLANPDVVPFLKDVLDEVCALFPCEYINIGGDEVPRDAWNECPKCQARLKEKGWDDVMMLQRELVGEMEKYLLSKGKKMIGWGEIFEGCSDPSTTVLSWKGTETGIKAALKGMHSVMCPGEWLYLDYYQTPERGEREPLSIHPNRFTTLSKTYSYDPLAGIPADKQTFVSGIQGNLWAEYIGSFGHWQHMALPRLAAVAEINWSGSQGKTSYEAFHKRVACTMLPLYNSHGWKYAPYEFR